MMRPARQLPVDQCCVSGNDLPKAIWMPAFSGLPSCYQGTPLQMVEEMARYMKPGLGIHDAIDILVRSLAEEKGVHIDMCFPDHTAEPVQAAMFVCALLFTRVAHEMPQA